MNIAKKLEQTGLNKKEARIYLASLELGESTIQEIAKKSGVKRTSIYNLVDDLVKRGVIEVVNRGNKRKFVAVNPATLRKMVLKRTKIFEETLPQLNMLFGQAKFKPRVRFYEGIEGIKTVFNDTLLEGKEIKAFSDYNRAYKTLGGFAYSYITERVKLGIFAKVISYQNRISDDFKVRDQKALREIRFLPEDKFPFDIEINIYGKKVAFMTFSKENPAGVIIEHPDITRSMESIFDLAWEYTELMKNAKF